MGQLPNNQGASNALVAVNTALQAQLQEFDKLLPSFLIAQRERFFQIALENVARPEIARCEVSSIVSAVLKSAQLGLVLDGTQAALVPFNQKDAPPRCEMIAMYRGMIENARRSKRISRVWGSVVWGMRNPDGDGWIGDRFEERLGSQRVLIHERDHEFYDETTDKPMHEVARGAYACAEWDDGKIDFVYLTKGRILTIKKNVKARNGPWFGSDEEEMWVKTAFRKLGKFLPVSIEFAQYLSWEEQMSADEPRAAEFEEVRAASNASVGTVAPPRTAPQRPAPPASRPPKKAPDPESVAPPLDGSPDPAREQRGNPKELFGISLERIPPWERLRGEKMMTSKPEYALLNNRTYGDLAQDEAVLPLLQEIVQHGREIQAEGRMVQPGFKFAALTLFHLGEFLAAREAEAEGSAEDGADAGLGGDDPFGEQEPG